MEEINVKDIKNPEFLKDLSYKELNTLSGKIREEILDVVSKNGGHLSSNLGCVESTIALCRVFDFPKDKIIFDVGHQCYTYKILSGRNLSSLRTKDGISGFQKKNESEFDCYECGHSSTSIGAAMGIAEARDINNENFEVIAFIGDSSFENGLALEAINNLAKRHTKVIVVLNDNEMSIGANEGGLSRFFRKLSSTNIYVNSKKAYKKVMGITKLGRILMKPFSALMHWLKRHLISQNLFDVLDIKYIGSVDGHNIKSLEKAFKKAKKFNEPVVVNIKTVKGKGVSYTEKDKIGIYHGVGPFNKENGEVISDLSKTSWQKEVSKNLDLVMEENDKAVVICPATGLGSALNDIQNKYKNRFYDVGICEEHSLIFASGLATNGIHPFISIYSTFLQRGYDEISHDLARMNLSSTLLIDRAGLVGNDGETHQGIFDVSFLYTIPNCAITMPSNPSQILSLLKESCKNHGVFAIRYPKESITKEPYSNVNLKFGEWLKETNTDSKTAIVSYGPVVNDIKKALENGVVKADLFNAVYLRPILKENIENLMNYEKVVIYDEYSTQQGFVNELVSRLIENGYKGKIDFKAIPNSFITQGTIKEQKADLGLSIDNLVANL